MPKKPDDLPQSLDPGVLRRETDPATLGFATTACVTDIAGLVGQERAVDAIRLAASIPHFDFNLFVLGPAGTGRHRTVDALLTKEAAKRPLPCDWIYVNNFETPHRPKALQLPSGSAAQLKQAMEELVDDLTVEISAVFESDDYQTRRRVIEEEFSERHENTLADFHEEAQARNVAVLRTPTGFTLVAAKDGEIIKPDAYEQLDAAEQRRIEGDIEELQNQLADILRAMPALEKEHRDRVGQLHAELAEQGVSGAIAMVRGRFEAIKPIALYLEQVQRDMIANAELFLHARHEKAQSPFPEEIVKYHRSPMFQRYGVNVMVSHDEKQHNGAPLEKEALPSLVNLTGRIEHQSEMGTLQTNFTLIKPGALHRANGGYLVLDARRLLTEPFAWEALKRCLDNREISINSAADILSLVSTTSLEPDPIPLDLRIILIGDRMLYALLSMFDPDFARLFKLQADFNDEVARSAKTLKLLARVIATSARRDGLRPLTAHAVARLLDEAVRLAEDSKRYSLKLSAMSDTMREADHYAGAAGRSNIDHDDITRAVTEAERRASRIRDRSHEMITRNTILIDTSGSVVGQINGLSVVSPGTHRFGQPSRITARVRVGTGKLVDIEREVELGGPLHSKGVLILSGYLATHYALDAPLSLHASIVFEQSYGGVDGDSASSAELYALLSALSGVAVGQNYAVTGSVNQNGEVQASGGVNEKIEGFYDICKARRLTGKQGVLIPASNADHLMLRPDVVAAVEKGRFKVIPIETIDQGIAVLTGKPAGRRGRGGAFPEGSVNALAENRMREFASLRQSFMRRNDTERPGP